MKIRTPIKHLSVGFCGGPAVKNPPVLEMRFGPWVRRSPGEGNGHPFHSCVGNPMDRGAWWAAVREAAKESDMTWCLKQKQLLKGIFCKELVLVDLTMNFEEDTSRAWMQYHRNYERKKKKVAELSNR